MSCIEELNRFIQDRGISPFEKFNIPLKNHIYSLSVKDLLLGIDQKGTAKIVLNNLQHLKNEKPDTIRAYLYGVISSVINQWHEGLPDYQIYKVQSVR